jgi:hypothetical protein
MPDSNITLSAIQAHTAALDGATKRHVANGSRCKVWSAGIVAGVIVVAAGKPQMGALPWVCGVVALLAFVDACQVVMARGCTAAYNSLMRKLPLNGGNAMKAEECFLLPVPEWRHLGQLLGVLGCCRCCRSAGRCWRWRSPFISKIPRSMAPRIR